MEDNKNRIKIIPLGGFDKIGMNMTVVEYGGTIIAMDCGKSFSPNGMPGVSASIPDITYLKENIEKVKGIVLTHGHEDHIGALPYIAKELKVPIYGTPLTIELVEGKLRDHEITGIRTKAVKQGMTIIVGELKVEFIRTDHSIPDSAMLAIFTPCGIIVNTGDFKFDLSPVTGETTDFARLSRLGDKGVLAVLSDSTNSVREGLSESEGNVNEKLASFMNLYKHNRLIIVTFSSNMSRIQQIITLGHLYNRKIAIEGNPMLRIFSIARRLGYINVPEDILIDINDIDRYPDDQLILVTTGNHGGAVQCIANIAEGKDPRIKIRENDTVLFSSIAMNGSETSFNNTLSRLEEQGAIVEFQDIHATGHACADDLRFLYSLLHPRFVIPAHGDYRYRREAKRIAESVGIPANNILLADNGDIIELSQDSLDVTGHMTLNEILIDGYEESRIDEKVLKERQQLSESGILMIELCIDRKTGQFVSGLRITERGFMEGSRFKALAAQLEPVVLKKLSAFISQGVRDERMSNGVRETVEKYIEDNFGKTPIVAVLLTGVSL
ncbi:MAG: ribonuclease J [Lachnospiraceae bacterium]|nr:ribonuclease J [Lachnospiraceae bacterium]